MGGSRLARYALSNGWSEREVRVEGHLIGHAP